jgi:hypothetical protein
METGMPSNRFVLILFITCTLALTAACSFGPPSVGQPSISASEAASQAMAMYDADGNGTIAGDELKKSPALVAALPRLDTNGDGGVSEDEIEARVNAWKEMQTGMTTVRCHVTLDGQPLVGANVVFEPEAFLGDEIKTARGMTNVYGDVAPTIAPEDRPDPTLPGGAHFGLYKVRFSKIVNGKETIPAQYNSETIVGQEVSYDDPAMKNHKMMFDLKSAPSAG